MNKNRCDWCNTSKLYQDYHDNEWGIPSHDDQYLFETLILETMQAGLSWYTVLLKRENYRRALDNFNYKKMAKYNDAKLASLMQDTGIIRNRLKIHSFVKNAQAFMKIQSEFGTFDKFIWGFTNNKTIKNNRSNLNEIPSKTELSDTISKELKKRGFTFVGSTTIYAYLQAIGIVNDHIKTCYKYKK